jgi:hypothetical protein
VGDFLLSTASFFDMDETKVRIFPSSWLLIERTIRGWQLYTYQLAGLAGATGERMTIKRQFEKYKYDPAALRTRIMCVNGGNLGFYLADVAGEAVHYCGCSWDDVSRTFNEKQIGIIVDSSLGKS